MNKKRLIITSVISIVLVAVLMIGSTYSIFTSTEVDESANVYKTGVLDITYTLSEDNITLDNGTPISNDKSCKLTPYRITVTNNGNVPYMFDVILNETTASDAISPQYIGTQVGKLEPKLLSETTNNVIKEDIIVPANSSVDVDVRVWISDTVQNSEIGKSFYAKLAIDGLAVYNDNEVNNSNLIADMCLEPNAPNLDSGNLIPVYYDNSAEVWKKADSENTDYSWYDYDNKMWANAILVSDETARSTYQSASVGATITDSDITAFYVWIPRFKYRVWNITRQAGEESTYAYSAYSEGIDIKWESGTASTGNVECTYNKTATASSTNLSDTCIYNGTETITTTSGNTNYTNAWYTHPAFTFGDDDSVFTKREIEGFWIGKFVVSGTADAPVTLPDLTANVSLSIDNQFVATKVFQSYGLSDNIDAHMLTNLEWGAVAYLTYSDYGLCSNSSCSTGYYNNSSSYYTGRSAGTNTSNSTYGSYDYKGYAIDSSTGSATTTNDTSVISSTTGNITGVYDMMTGNGYEHVMGNSLDSSGGISLDYAGTAWSSILGVDDPKGYYTGYSYQASRDGQSTLNRSWLGDAIAEVSLTAGTYFPTVWNSTSTYNGFAVSDGSGVSWFSRWGKVLFEFNSYGGTGGSVGPFKFRSTLS